MRFRTLTFIFVTENDVSRKLSGSIHPPVREDSYAVAMTSGRCELRKLYVATHLVHGPEIFEMSKFSEKLALVRGSGF